MLKHGGTNSYLNVKDARIQLSQNTEKDKCFLVETSILEKKGEEKNDLLLTTWSYLAVLALPKQKTKLTSKPFKFSRLMKGKK